MAIVQAGKTFSAMELQQTAGNVAWQIRDYIQSGMNLKGQLESWADADLIELGLTQEQVNAIKGFFIGDMPGFATLLNQSVWIKQLIGTGV